MIIRGGYNVYPREIEEVLYTHSDIIECVAIGVPDNIYGEKIVAFIVSTKNKNPEDYVKYYKENLVHYKIPNQILFPEELPKSDSGQIIKSALRK
jgi:long-chain acyl-CoA synthetase